MTPRDNNKPEVWMRGAVPAVPGLLQPVAHALLQVIEELHDLLQDFPDELLWQRPAGVASVGFHLQHMAGVLDRLFTYAAGNSLSKEQLDYLASEGKPPSHLSSDYFTAMDNSRLKEPITNSAPEERSTERTLALSLTDAFNIQVEKSIDRLKSTDPSTLTAERFVGRKRLPSTVIGLLFHSAEHTTRHYGQLLVTVRVLKGVKS